MIEVAPSVLAADFANLERDCRTVLQAGCRTLHYDVMDGVFVKNISVGVPVLQSLKKAIPDAFYDVHLMIVCPDQYVEAFAKAGADALTFHVESESDVAKTIAHIRELGVLPGLSLRPDTPVEALFPYLSLLDRVLVMSVEPGFGGQAFRKEAPVRIAALRCEAQRQNTELLLAVDGGINAQTAPLCAGAGAELLVAGSAVFAAQNAETAVREILSNSTNIR